MDGLWKRGTFQLVDFDEIHPNSNILCGRFVLAFNDGDMPKETWKGRFVVQGFCDSMKTSLVHDNSNARPQAVKILVNTAANLMIQVFAVDVCQAYLQSAKKLLKDVWTKPLKRT